MLIRFESAPEDRLRQVVEERGREGGEERAGSGRKLEDI